MIGQSSVRGLCGFGVAGLIIGMGFGTASAQMDTLTLKPLRGDALLKAYKDQTHDLTYRNPQGILGKYRHSETHNPDGTTVYREGGQSFAGEWRLVGAPGDEGVICFRYPKVDADRQHCFSVFTEGNCLYSYSVGTLRAGKPVSWELWNSRGANRNDGGACEAAVS